MPFTRRCSILLVSLRTEQSKWADSSKKCVGYRFFTAFFAEVVAFGVLVLVFLCWLIHVRNSAFILRRLGKKYEMDGYFHTAEV